VKDWWQVALVVVLGLLGTGILFIASGPPRGNPIQLLPPPTPTPIQVHVTGAVNQPGVYTLPANNRVHDAIQAAGGFTDEANDQAINLAAPLQDGLQIWVPSRQPNQESGPGSETGENSDDQRSTTSGSLININTATQEELETLPQIGSITAEKIINYRQTEGYFISIEDIQKVPGIGPATYEKIKDLITVGGL
jgi:competence protein ComEA